MTEMGKTPVFTKGNKMKSEKNISMNVTSILGEFRIKIFRDGL